MASFPWSVLGIAPTSDTKAIRSAYAARIKAMDLDADVEGYATLRSARDTALRMAKTLPDEPLPDEPLPIEDDAAAEPEPAPPLQPLSDFLTPDFAAAEAETTVDDTALLADYPDPFEPPLLDGHDDAPGPGVDALQSPFTRLATVLDEDDPEADPLDEAQAAPLLDAVLDAIHWAPIDRQAELEQWLADRLAQSWPRSAPLLERATAALDWEREWGRIDARPSVEYLGARLRGQRFTAKVQSKDHRYYRAWAELSRPGKSGLLRHLRAHGGDVRGLLAGIRKNFPELEDRFDTRRVSSWEQVRSWPTGLIVFGGLLLLGVLISIADPKPEAQRNAYRATVEEVFGAGNDVEWLNRNQPDLATTLSKRMTYTPEGELDREATIAAGLALVRARIYLDGRQMTGADFDTTMRLRLSLLQAAKADSPAACREMMALNAPPSTTRVSPEIRTQERRFAADLAERTALGPPAKAQGRSTSVPAALVRQVLDETGLTQEQVKAAMRKDDDPNRCSTTIALLKATLAWQGPERHDILMTL